MKHEFFMRPRTAALTLMESNILSQWVWKHQAAKGALEQLEKMGDGDKKKGKQKASQLQDMQRVIQYFGRGPGTRSATRKLITMLHGEKSFEMGVMCAEDTVEWTVCKHLFLTFCQPLKVNAPESTVTCCCLPRTAFMLTGCPHNKVALYSTAVAQGYYFHTLCAACSTCARCNG